MLTQYPLADKALMRPTLSPELQLVQSAVAAIRKVTPMMLKGLGNDLLYSVAHGSSLQRCFALILASSGMRIITPVAMIPANQSSVRRALLTDSAEQLYCPVLRVLVRKLMQFVVPASAFAL